jgi:transposase
MLYTSKLTSAVFLKFLPALNSPATSQVVWIVDKHPVHRAKQVQQWLGEHTAQIEMFILASYSPQLNPAEYLNCDVKQGIHSKSPTRNLAQLKRRARIHLHKLQKLPARMSSISSILSLHMLLKITHSQLLPG